MITVSNDPPPKDILCFCRDIIYATITGYGAHRNGPEKGRPIVSRLAVLVQDKNGVWHYESKEQLSFHRKWSKQIELPERARGVVDVSKIDISGEEIAKVKKTITPETWIEFKDRLNPKEWLSYQEYLNGA